MKKILLIFIVVCLIFTLIGCSKRETEVEPQIEVEEVDSPDEDETAETETEDLDASEDEPFVGAAGSVSIGDFTIEAEWIPFEESLIVTGTGTNNRVAVVGEDYFVLVDGKLLKYTLSEGKLIFQKELPLENEYTYLFSDKKGILYLSEFRSDFIAMEGEEQIFSHKDFKYVSIHPSGEWGISWFSGSDVEKIKIGERDIESEGYKFNEVNLLSEINITNDYIFVNALSSTENEEPGSFVYDLDGNLKYTLGNVEYGEDGSVGAVIAAFDTENGFMCIDVNYRSIFFWDKDGKYIDRIEAEDLFGTSQPWLSTAIKMDDGSVVIGMTQKRDEGSTKEFLLYRINGF